MAREWDRGERGEEREWKKGGNENKIFLCLITCIDENSNKLWGKNLCGMTCGSGWMLIIINILNDFDGYWP
jgi:hypothetical protein